MCKRAEGPQGGLGGMGPEGPAPQAAQRSGFMGEGPPRGGRCHMKGRGPIGPRALNDGSAH